MLIITKESAEFLEEGELSKYVSEIEKEKEDEDQKRKAKPAAV